MRLTADSFGLAKSYVFEDAAGAAGYLARRHSYKVLLHGRSVRVASADLIGQFGGPGKRFQLYDAAQELYSIHAGQYTGNV